MDKHENGDVPLGKVFQARTGECFECAAAKARVAKYEVNVQKHEVQKELELRP